MVDSNRVETDWVDSLEGASTAFLTNTVRLGLDDIDIACLASPVLPVSCAPRLIHEATHHWCFQTRVGEALTFAKTLAYDLANKGDLSGAADMRCRYNCLHTLMRPLVEGIALFTEFDGNHVLNKVAISPYNILPIFYLKHPEFDKLRKDWSGNIVTLLIDWLRSWSFFADAKNRLYSAHGSQAVNYLFGYHDVKRWWLEFYLRDEDDYYRDGEGFIKLLFLYFFCDFKIAKLIFDTSVTLEKSVEQLYAYLRRRVEDFPKLAGNHALTKELKTVRPGISIEDGSAWGIFDLDAADGLTASGEAMFALVGNRRLDESDIPALKILNNRRAFMLASEPVRLSVRGKHITVMSNGGIKMFEGELGGSAPNADEDAHFSSYVLMRECALVNIATCRDTVLFRSIHAPSKLSDGTMEEIEQIETNRSVVDNLLRDVEQRLSDYVSTHHRQSGELTARCENMKKKLFGFAGCMQERRGHAEIWLSELEQSGLSACLGNPDSLYALALIGIHNSRAVFSRNEIENILREAQIGDGMQAIESLIAAKQDHLPPLASIGWNLLVPYDRANLIALI